MKSIYYYETAIGLIGIEDNGCAITRVFLQQEDSSQTVQEKKSVKEKVQEKETVLILETAKQLKEYFNGKRTSFDVPIELEGTEFQKSVWNALCTIPYGETRSYGQIASQIGNPKAVRAVGGANNKNKLIILVPCHRVIGADKSLTGFACGIEIKEGLLKLERSI